MPKVFSTSNVSLYRQLKLPSKFACRRFPFVVYLTFVRASSTEAGPSQEPNTSNSPLGSHLNPSPDDYSRTVFADKCRLILQAGSGGHGCVSFLREKFISAGPPNGGDGGSGGNIYIQAVNGETSLHKLAYQRIFKATRGRNGQGKSKGGQRGEDVLIQVPVGTIVREIARLDPIAVEEESRIAEEEISSPLEADGEVSKERHKWIVAPSAGPSEIAHMRFPDVPRPRRTHLAAAQPPAPIFLDLSKPMEEPVLLVAGAAGGLGNSHFVNKSVMRPLIATKGHQGMRLEVELELKLLADLGFVGLPNAGKSTLLRSITRSRARVGNWAFTTLQPNIGTVVLDDHHGRAKVEAFGADGSRRTQFSIADIPGLVSDAHLDRGLGLDFLRHIERARVLAFVIDLADGNATKTLKALWKELDEFEKIKERQLYAVSDRRIVSWNAFGSTSDNNVGAEADIFSNTNSLPPIDMPPISSKPWFVVATKADLQDTQQNFTDLQEYLQKVESGKLPHPTARKQKWEGSLKAVPISALRGEGVDQVARQTISLLSR